MSVLDEIVKAYDVRGTVPDQLNADVARALGVAFARYAGADEIARSAATCARPARSSSPRSPTACCSQGVDVVDIGLASSDLVYFAAGHLDRPGVDLHRLAQPGRVQRRQVLPRGRPPGRRRRARRDQGRRQHRARRPRPAPTRPRAGTRSERDLLPAFVEHVLSFVDVDAIRPLRVVADTANGMGGLVVPAVFERIPTVELEVMYGELDGTFPNHPADPLQPANQRDLRHRVQGRRLRRRAGVRRRRRPRVRRRRARRRPVRLDDDGDPRRRRAAQRARARRSCTT